MDLKTVYEYIHFKLLEEKPKTTVWACHNNRSGAKLGVVKWGPWRAYAYYPTTQAVYSAGCLDDISAFVRQLEAKRKKRLKAEKERAEAVAKGAAQ